MFPGRSETDQLYRICAVLGKPSQWKEGYDLAIKIGFVYPNFSQCDIKRILPKANDKAIDIINRMLFWDPKARPSAQECLNHPYFSSL